MDNTDSVVIQSELQSRELPELLAASLVDLFSRGNLAELEARARDLTSVYPSSAFVWKVLGVALQDQGKPAMPEIRRATELQPNDAEIVNALANEYRIVGSLSLAISSYRQALAINPKLATAHCNLGGALVQMDQFGDPSNSNAGEFATNSILSAAQNRDCMNDAIASYRKAIELEPLYVAAHSNLGTAYKHIGQIELALESFRRALTIDPNYAIAHNNIGNALKDLGQLADARASYECALASNPSLIDAYSNLLYLHAFTRDISPIAERELAQKWEEIALQEIELANAKIRRRSFVYTPTTGRKLKLGIVSADLGSHPVTVFLEPVLAQLDSQKFHLTLFPTKSRDDELACRLRALAVDNISLVGVSDSEAAERIRKLGIDVLVDTTAHMDGCRLGIFAHRAAPVQCHYIGYHGTTGISQMDWFIGDEDLLPTACDHHFVEKIWRLPRVWVTYQGSTYLPESKWRPNPSGAVCLGSFNNLTKVREETLSLWGGVLQAIPNARLLLKDRNSSDAAVRRRIYDALAPFGVTEDRIDFAPRTADWASHMALYDQLDIALDAIPLNSATTAFDALWMGVPLVAMEGDWLGARISSAVLRSLGKPEWVAKNKEQYVKIVAALVRDASGRESLRRKQRQLMMQSPLCDAIGLTRSLELAFLEMYAQTQYDTSGVG